MALQNTQMSLDELSDDYKVFLEKFKPKKTTDDCYTPENIYIAVRDWACAEYGIKPAQIVRPFYPGGDYERFEYPDDCVVLDNPPFSFLADIVRFFDFHNIKYFLFAPALTCLNRGRSTALIVGEPILYANGAEVPTSFVTSFSPDLVIKTAPDLRALIAAENLKNKRKNKTELPKYLYPNEIITAAIAQRYCHYGIEYQVRRDEAFFVRALDAQKAIGKAIFGSGFLLSSRAAAERAAAERAAAERAAAERAAAERFQLSEKEREYVKILDMQSEERGGRDDG